MELGIRNVRIEKERETKRRNFLVCRPKLFAAQNQAETTFASVLSLARSTE
jgi:hypothetical protein